MTQEEKQLLLIDLCARLPYNFTYCYCNAPLAEGRPIVLTPVVISNLMNATDDLVLKPYLRPMSSITEEEKKEMHDLLSPNGTAIYTDKGIDIPLNHYGDHVEYEFMDRIIDYLNAHYLDHNNLISRELALEVKNDFYKIK